MRGTRCRRRRCRRRTRSVRINCTTYAHVCMRVCARTQCVCISFERTAVLACACRRARQTSRSRTHTFRCGWSEYHTHAHIQDSLSPSLTHTQRYLAAALVHYWIVGNPAQCRQRCGGVSGDDWGNGADSDALVVRVRHFPRFCILSNVGETIARTHVAFTPFDKLRVQYIHVCRGFFPVCVCMLLERNRAPRMMLLNGHVFVSGSRLRTH